MFYVPLYIEALRSRPNLLFWAAALAQAIIWIVVPMVFYAAPPGDLPQLLAIGHEFQLRGDVGPPLAYWLAEIAFRLAGLFGVYALAQICVVTTYWCVFALGSAIVGPAHAAMAVLLMVGISLFTVPTPDFGPAILAMALWAVVLLHYWRAVGAGAAPLLVRARRCGGAAFAHQQCRADPARRARAVHRHDRARPRRAQRQRAVDRGDRARRLPVRAPALAARHRRQSGADTGAVARRHRREPEHVRLAAAPRRDRAGPCRSRHPRRPGERLAAHRRRSGAGHRAGADRSGGNDFRQGVRAGAGSAGDDRGGAVRPRAADRRRGAAGRAVGARRHHCRRRQHRAVPSAHPRLRLGRPVGGAGAVRAGGDGAVAVGGAAPI